jgi:hypothetical protein
VRFMRTLKDEHVDQADYTVFQDARLQIAHWLAVEYNTRRILSALNYVPLPNLNSLLPFHIERFSALFFHRITALYCLESIPTNPASAVHRSPTCGGHLRQR